MDINIYSLRCKIYVQHEHGILMLHHIRRIGILGSLSKYIRLNPPAVYEEDLIIAAASCYHGTCGEAVDAHFLSYVC